ncbi:unnamed protein product [Camellia sinensis]
MLPDSLVIHILSFLPTIENSIKTHVLSKRWQYLWTTLPSLVFRYRFYESCDTSYERNYDFIRFVDKTLLLCNSSMLKKSLLDFNYVSEFTSNINSWTLFTTRNAAKELQLKLRIPEDDLSEDELFVLPQELFTNSSFRELRFSICNLMPKGVVCWKLLKTLPIGYVKLNDGVIDKILEGSPVLENLELYYFYVIGDFGFLGSMNCQLADVSALVNTNLNCYLTSYVHDDYEWHQNVLRGLLESLVHVKNLTLGSWALKVLSIMEMKGLRSPLSKCECLTLRTCIAKSVLPGIACLLESSSHLETLVIISKFSSCPSQKENATVLQKMFIHNPAIRRGLREDNTYCQSLVIITSPANNEVKFFGTISPTFSILTGRTIGHYKRRLSVFDVASQNRFTSLGLNYSGLELSFVQFLLNNARVLQKMVINMQMADDMVRMDLFQAAQKFLSFPRSSPKSQCRSSVHLVGIHINLKMMSRRSQMYEEHSDSSDHVRLAKLPKTCSNRTTVVDRMSMLPDSLLIHILSFLPTIEDAIKTHVLSKRWQYLWTSVPSLLFSYPDIGSDIYYSRLVEFATFVDRTLVLSNCSKLKKFVVEFEYDSRLFSNVNLWIRFATRNATEELQLDLYNATEGLPEEDRFVLPQLFFTNSFFTELLFSFCILVPKRVVDWKLLKKLSIGYVKLNDAVIQKILAGSPVLEILELYSFYGITRLHVTKPSLKKLILRKVWEYKEQEEVGIHNEHNSQLEISAPNLQSLKISGSLGRTNYRLADISSLVDATLDCYCTSYVDHHRDYEWYQNSLTGLLESLVHVKNLTLGSWALEVLSAMEMKDLRSPLSKCECLTIDTRIEESILLGIANILESCSHLETLVITMSPGQCAGRLSGIGSCCAQSTAVTVVLPFQYIRDSLTNDFSAELYRISQKMDFELLMMHLKTVKFAGLRWYYSDFDFSFVQFLLKNALVLQKMVIKVGCIPQKECFQAAQRFLSFPRSSPDAVIMFHYEPLEI